MGGIPLQGRDRAYPHCISLVSLIVVGTQKPHRYSLEEQLVQLMDKIVHLFYRLMFQKSLYLSFLGIFQVKHLAHL